MDIKDPASSTNRDGTVKENGEGTLGKCNCGREFTLSFADGLCCGYCKTKITKEMIDDAYRKLKERDQGTS
jgi:hypothetical protein